MAQKLNSSETGLGLRTKFNANATLLENTPQLNEEGQVDKESLPDFNILSGDNITIEEDPGNNSLTINSTGGSLLDMVKLLFGYAPGGGPQVIQIEDDVLTLVPFPVGGGTGETLGATVLSAGTANADSIPYAWDVVPDAESYILQLSTASNFSSPISNSYSVNFGMPTGLPPNTQYYARVRAAAPGYTSGPWSNTITKTTDVAGNITPPAPSLFVGNDSTNAVTFTPSAGSAASLHEWRRRVGGVWSAYFNLTSASFNVGDFDIAIGDVEVRRKATTGYNVSAPLVSNTEFTATVIDNGTALTEITAYNWDSSQGTNQNDVVYGPSNSLGLGDAVTSLKMDPSANGWLRASGTLIYDPGTPEGINGIGRIGFSASNTTINNSNQLPYAIYLQDNQYGRKINSVKNGSGSGVDVSFSDISLIRIQIRVDATLVYFEYSLDGGVSFLQHGSPIARPAGTLYPRLLVESSYGIRNLKDIRQKGLTAI